MRQRTGRQAVTWLVVVSTIIAADASPAHASELNGSEGKIAATFQSLDISAARVTFRDNQTAEVRTLHVSESKALKRMVKMKEGQELCLRYRRAAGATEPEIIGMSRTGDGWKRGAKIVVGVGVLFGLLVLGALLFGGD
jgi:hypothetical protein